MNDPINLALNKSAAGADNQGLGMPLMQDGTTNAVQGSHESGKVCRICLDEEEDISCGNPFITPCKCTGSMKYIHLKCLREWTDSKK